MPNPTRRKFIKQSSSLALMPYLWNYQEKPDLILHNGNFITVDPNQPRAEAVAIIRDRLFAVGSNRDVLALANGNTKKIDLEGSTVLPGFIDAHSHPASSGRYHLFSLDCDLRSIEEIKALVSEKAKTTPKGRWIYGFKYDDTKTKEGRFINVKDLDEAAPDHPVAIRHRGGHTAYVNSMAFLRTSINTETPNPPGGKFVQKDGKLTGRILENAMYPFYKDFPKFSDEDYVKGVDLISRMLTETGITSVQDAGSSPEDLNAFQIAYQRGLLKTRVYNSIRHWNLDRMIEAGIRTGLGDEWVRVGYMKTAIDGSISERTARLSQPYVGRPDDFGILTTTREELYERCKKAYLAGWQVGVHANGDVGIDITLGVYEQLIKETPKKDPRFRLEHCTVVNADLIKRIKALNAIPNPFSTYVYFHGEKMKEYGADRLENMFAVKSFLDAGIKVTQTSDYPPGPFEPMMALQSSVTRTDYNGTTWGPSQKVTVEEAIKVGTLHGAYASYEEDIKGSVTQGKLADLVVLEKDPTAVDPSTLIDIKVERTMTGGKWVYES